MCRSPAISIEPVRIVTALSFQTLANILSQAGTFTSLLIVARLLGHLQYGKFAFVQSTVITFNTVAGLGLGITATKYVSEYRLLDPGKASRVLGLTSIVAMASAALFGLVYLVACRSLIGEGYVGAMQIGSFAIVFSTLNGYQLGAMAGFEAFDKIARANAIVAIANPIGAALLTRIFGFSGALAALSLNGFSIWAIYHFTLRAQCRTWNCPVRYRGFWEERSVLFAMSAPACVSGIIGSIAIWGTMLMLSRVANGYAHIALFSAANSLRLMVTFFPNVLNAVMMPMLNSLLATGDRKRFERTFALNVVVSGCVACAGALVFLFFRTRLLGLFGRDFIDRDGVVPVLLLATVIEVAACSVYPAIFVYGRMWRQVVTIALWAATLLGTMRFGAVQGARGLATAYVGAWTVSLILYSYHAWSLNQRAQEEPIT